MPETNESEAVRPTRCASGDEPPPDQSPCSFHERHSIQCLCGGCLPWLKGWSSFANSELPLPDHLPFRFGAHDSGEPFLRKVLGLENRIKQRVSPNGTRWVKLDADSRVVMHEEIDGTALPVMIAM